MEQRQRDIKKDELYFAFIEKKISIHQFKAQMKDLGYSEWEIDLYLDGGRDGPE